MAYQRGGDGSVYDDLSDASEGGEDDTPSPLQAVVEYNKQQSMRKVLGIEGSSIDNNEVLVVVPVQQRDFAEFISDMMLQRMSVTLLYKDEIPDAGWYLSISRLASFGAVSSVDLEPYCVEKPQHHSATTVFVLRNSPVAIDLSWLRDANFCKLRVLETGMLQLVMPSNLVASMSSGAVRLPDDTDRPRLYTPDITTMRQPMGWCRFAWHLFCLAVLIAGILSFALVYFTT
jgi:hypothetical protein